jgi:protein-S-isoprenylcysteine O-methyltransferase
MLDAIGASFGLWFLLVGYLLLGVFLVAERVLRTGASAKTLQRGTHDRGSTLLIGMAFGVGLVLPALLDGLNVGVLLRNDVVDGSLAIGVMVAGIAVRIWAVGTLGRYYTRTLLTAEGQEVVTAGPYAKVRHPGYLGDILMWSGFGVLSDNLAVALLFPIMFVAIYLYRIRVEEGMLVKALGDDYVQYQKRTYRLVPFVY